MGGVLRWLRVAHNHTMHIDVEHWLRWWSLHLRWLWADAKLLARRTVQEFLDDHCTQLAASMSYYILFSIFPLAILAVSIAGLILTNQELHDRVVDALLSALPVSEGAGRENLESLIDPIAQGRSAIGLVSVFGLIWGASGMMGALRFSLNTAWDHEHRRPFVRGKLVDFALLLGVGYLLALSIGFTMLLQVARDLSDDVADALGPFGGGAGALVNVVSILIPFLLSTTTFTLVYKLIPSVPVRTRDAIGGALLSAVLFELLKNGFALYLRNFSNYDAVYGSLGATIALLFFIYLGSCVLLLGAELASELPRVMHGHYDAELESVTGGRRGPWYRRALLAATGLVLDDAKPTDAGHDQEAREAREQRREEERSERLKR